MPSHKLRVKDIIEYSDGSIYAVTEVNGDDHLIAAAIIETDPDFMGLSHLRFDSLNWDKITVIAHAD